MKAVILYHPNSDHERQVLDYVRDYKQLRNRDIETLSLETVEGAEMAKLYGITSYPAVVATSNDGQLQNLWQGGELPLMNELDYYTMQQ